MISNKHDFYFWQDFVLSEQNATAKIINSTVKLEKKERNKDGKERKKEKMEKKEKMYLEQ